MINDKIMQFALDRDWLMYHTPRNIAESLTLECAELLELFQWDNQPTLEEMEYEIADILIYAIQLCNILCIDYKKIIEKKLVINERKYPVDKSKGTRLKWNKLK